MISSAITRLLERADDGVDTDEVVLLKSGDDHRLSVAGRTYGGLSVEEVRDILSEHSASVREWHFWHEVAPGSPARHAFLRWVEDADDMEPSDRRKTLRTDGCSQTWGQVRVHVRIDADDGRVYELRHVDDQEVLAEALDEYSDPLDARELRKLDEDDRYRPLSTAPTLQSGWIFPDLGPEGVARAVNTFYPATIANWYRERYGELDVTHWDEATERQTGIYSVTAELRGEAVDWVAEACCVDSQCLKRREWDAADDRELSVPRGDGVFPCREPCSLVIAAARKWALLEREEEKTYTIRLTPSEKEQIEGLLHAVADSTTGDIREADVGAAANRYRARYLRAKRADENGHLNIDDPTDKPDD